MDLDLVPPGGFQKRCDIIYAELQAYASQNGLNLHMTGLTKKILGCDRVSEFPSAYRGSTTSYYVVL